MVLLAVGFVQRNFKAVPMGKNKHKQRTIGELGLIQRVCQLKLRGGPVDKISLVLIATTIAVAVIARSDANIWVAGGSIAALTGTVLILSIRMLSLVERNPAAAMLDAKQYLKYQKQNIHKK